MASESKKLVPFEPYLTQHAADDLGGLKLIVDRNLLAIKKALLDANATIIDVDNNVSNLAVTFNFGTGSTIALSPPGLDMGGGPDGDDSMAIMGNFESRLTFSTGLTRTGNTITANLSTGIAGGQSAIGGTVSGDALTFHSNTSNDGKIIVGSTSLAFFDEAATTRAAFQVGTSSTTPVGTVAHFNRDTTGYASLNISNPNAGAGASSGLTLMQSTTSFAGSALFFNLQSSGFGALGVITANSGLLELQATGAAPIVYSVYGNTAGADHIFTTTTSRNERLRIANGGNVSVANLSGSGFVRTDGSGVLSNATLPLNHRVMTSAGPTADPTGNVSFQWDSATQVLFLGAGASQTWANLGNLGDANTEYVESAWAANVWTLKSKKTGTGTVRAMKIDADTSTLTLKGNAGFTLQSTSNTIQGETGGTGHDLHIDGNGTDSKLASTNWDDFTILSIHNASIVGGNTMVVTGSPTQASAAPSTTFALKLSAGATFTGSTLVATMHHVVVPRPSIAKGDAGAVTVTDSASLYIENAPLAGGSITITNPYAVWIDNGLLRYDGAIALGGGAAATLGTIGGSGPGTAAQNKWIKMNVDGTNYFIPLWL